MGFKVSTKVRRTILSCKTLPQLRVAERMLNQYAKHYDYALFTLELAVLNTRYDLKKELAIRLATKYLKN